jgi:predicted metal-dependent hydrolase
MIHNNNSREFKDRIRYGSINLEYHIKRSKRIKTSELIVDSDRIEIRIPLNKNLENTRDIVRDKAEWIVRKQEQLKSLIPEINKPTFEDNSTLPYLGKNCYLKINRNQPTDALRFVNGKFIIDVANSNASEDTRLQTKKLYEEWLKRTAYKIFKKRTEIYAQKVEVTVKKISVKNSLKSRWASLTKKDSINYNIHLIKALQDVIDYIALHEICHLKLRGHSHHYWALLYRYMPNYQDKIEWLNANGRSMLGACSR